MPHALMPAMPQHPYRMLTVAFCASVLLNGVDRARGQRRAAAAGSESHRRGQQREACSRCREDV